ncbi:tol-pal system protein YbgF [Pseudomonas sp. BAY1663]|uniref:Cell division coordinator CpoB n=1 Tax=Stutzerimonas stutzeri TaxID=316 RepID=A0A2N8T242_STUST|nr:MULTISPECIES: tol-pal system protein YbgF [Pseudomonadaceae]EXF46535.1 tol-pal system protein YbgF [Pseudomonas sp. BAY1663]MCQ4324291.1 tol-pal system protein YbgF [Stutzerimonas stutzeri]PNG08812.1 tol-pal system protein YbgF [Stutzerimonas stutzeri]
MRKYRHALTFTVLGLPLAAVAQVPVVDYEQGAASGGSGYSTAAPSGDGAYAGGGAAAPSSAQGMLFLQLQQMQEEIAQLRGMLEEQQNQIQRLQQEGLERYQDIDRRLSSGAAGVNQAAPAPTPSTAGAGAPAASQAQAGSQAGDPEQEKLYYDAAFDLIKAKDFDKASQAFAAFLRKYPNSQYAGNAQYWLGEVNLAKGDLQGAGQAFARVSQAYPQHSKVPDSLYKLADVELRLGNRDKAQGILRQVIAQYPNTSAAQLAQRQLNR